jgi:hypothetical protein
MSEQEGDSVPVVLKILLKLAIVSEMSRSRRPRCRIGQRSAREQQAEIASVWIREREK